MTKLRDERELLSKPGDTILETIEHLKMSQVELAERMGKTPPKINDITAGKEPITILTALQLEKVLGIDAQFWLNRETLYREKLSRIQEEEALELSLEWLKVQPRKHLKEYGYLKSDKIDYQTLNECLQFYGIASPIQWETFYVNNIVSTQFRKSGAYKVSVSSLIAWLRIGELEMKRLTLPAFNKEHFKESLKDIRKLVKIQPEDYAQQLKAIAFKAGVCIVFSICIPGAPVSGATRWIAGNPLIQITDRFKFNDEFWFTIFHEAGHVLLHGRKDIFIEDFIEANQDEEKEAQANDFANKVLLPYNIESEFENKFSESDIRRVAIKYDTHPAIVLYRLKELELVNYSFGNSLRYRITFVNLLRRGDHM
ncbi:MAG: ImmA/IrrE family metallo-endopeptidase [Chitinophagaceae bacterium]|nr:ImmA/IrrE family metallo-endopeptidase [Chitinophagaceae bacterium]